MFYWIWVVEPLGILVAIVLYLVVTLVAHAIWKVVSDAVAVADMPLPAQLFDLLKLWILV